MSVMAANELKEQERVLVMTIIGLPADRRDLVLTVVRSAITELETLTEQERAFVSKYLFASNKDIAVTCDNKGELKE